MYIQSDADIIKRHSISIRARARIELMIVKQLIASAEKAGYTLAVEEYEDEGETTGIDYDVRSAIFNLDDAHVSVIDRDGKYIGCVYLVLGNDGYDIISDYSDNDAINELLTECNALADKLEQTGGGEL
jgi:hypothetical protein